MAKTKAAPKTDVVADAKSVLTREGYDKLIEELNERKKVKRVEIANKLESATEQGDLSENSAYKSALEEKELNEAKIEEIEKMLADSTIVAQDTRTHIAGIGDKVVLKSLADDKTVEYTLVGKSETDPAKGYISVESPVGKAVYGRTIGETVDVNLPLKTVKYKIAKIN